MSSQTSTSSKPIDPSLQPPWWRLPIVWMVIAGPAIVVVAAIGTAVVAVRNVDPVLDTSKDQPNLTRAEVPAMQGRNHAAEQSHQPADR
jgi:hypothetical protein